MVNNVRWPEKYQFMALQITIICLEELTCRLVHLSLTASGGNITDDSANGGGGRLECLRADGGAGHCTPILLHLISTEADIFSINLRPLSKGNPILN